MKSYFIILFVLSIYYSNAQPISRTTINLNGTWEFEQTVKAFPPNKFTRTIPVPGLIHLAIPKIDDYDKFFRRPEKVEAKEQHNLYNIDYRPKYNWYRKKIFVPADLKGSESVITLKKSQYVTQVYINGFDLGTSVACYTPVEFVATNAIKFGEENEILIKVGDRVWLPSEAAGGTDKEKEHYLPGIWDDVQLTFTGKMRVNRILVLPSVKDKNIHVKTLIRNFLPSQIFYGDDMTDSILIKTIISEKITGKEIATHSSKIKVKRDNLTQAELIIPVNDFKAWSPESPFLYTAKLEIYYKNKLSDQLYKNFGMRDFERRGKFFYLNGKQYFLRGTNITLQRFFEDPDCSDLVWDKNWVKKLLIDFPKQLNWNAMRICVGIVPDFWYDLADEYGLMFQNEWLYWQNHGWDDQIRKEYTDWVWSDGNHPSIAIWDAINENWDDYIGNQLIPELKKLDPTRIWDAGYMSGDQMTMDEMDEPHPYQGFLPWDKQEDFEKNPYPLGNLDFKPEIMRNAEISGAAQLVNEYGWIWLWRNGAPSKLTVNIYKYYLGENSTAQQNRELQAYWSQLETEWLRSNTNVAGVLAFCYLANNYGYTGDWFTDNIKDLKPGPTMLWFRHCFAPAAVFINLTDERYTKHVLPHTPGTELVFNLAGINNLDKVETGSIQLSIYDENGIVVQNQKFDVHLAPLTRTNIPVNLKLPEKAGGYLMVSAFLPEGATAPIISRRYIKIGKSNKYNFFEIKPAGLN
ncbi:MAG: glycoside hydrolase family 2 TIM barrel-domain containing protein [Bacteroidales bacterium]